MSDVSQDSRKVERATKPCRVHESRRSLETGNDERQLTTMTEVVSSLCEELASQPWFATRTWRGNCTPSPSGLSLGKHRRVLQISR
jgi:hypothetical protein